jgi:hypothetical protein
MAQSVGARCAKQQLTRSEVERWPDAFVDSTTLCRPGSLSDRAEGKLPLLVALLRYALQPPCSTSYRSEEPSKSDPAQPLNHPCLVAAASC